MTMGNTWNNLKNKNWAVDFLLVSVHMEGILISGDGIILGGQQSLLNLLRLSLLELHCYSVWLT